MLNILLIAITVIGVFVAFRQVKASMETKHAEVIDRVWSGFADLTSQRIAHPEAGHLFETPATYAYSRQLVRDSVGLAGADTTLPNPERAKLCNRERALAMRNFEHYELVWKQHEVATVRKHREEIAEVLRYFYQDLLVNPRLHALWDQGLSHYLDEGPRKDLDDWYSWLESALSSGGEREIWKAEATGIRVEVSPAYEIAAYAPDFDGPY